MNYPPFVRDYPFGTGLLIAFVLSTLYTFATSSKPEFHFGMALICVWLGYHLRVAEEDAIADVSEE